MRRRLLLALAGLTLAVAGLRLFRAPRERGSPPTPSRHLVRLEPASGQAELVGDGASTKLRAITTDIPGTLSWRVELPPGARLETHLAFVRSELPGLQGRVCHVRVEAGEEGSAPIRVARELTPASHWEPFFVDLAPLGGRTVDVRLSLACGENGRENRAAAARWSVPLVFGPRAPEDLNVLLITVDTLRADHLGAYGHGRATSPHIDGLARRGLVFANAETVQSATWPALTSLHTSLYPSTHGVVWNGHRAPTGLSTLAEVLHARDYSTSAYITNMTRGRHPGFSRLFLSRDGGQAEADRVAVDQATAQLRLEKDRRFFMWVHLLSPHADYDPPPPHASAFARPSASRVKAEIEALARLRRRGLTLTASDVAHVVDLYDGEIAYVDEQVGRLLDALRSLELERNTLVVLTADHGEDLYEHNRHFFHSPSIYGSSMRIPLVLALPGLLPAGQVTDHLASIVDVAPTVLALLGLPPVKEFAGAALLTEGRLPERPARDLVFGETGGVIHSVRSREWRFVHNPSRYQPEAPGGPYPIAEVELYDLRADPREARNVAPDRPEIVRALTAELQAFRARHLRTGRPPSEVAPEALEELRALGYLAQ